MQQPDKGVRPLFGLDRDQRPLRKKKRGGGGGGGPRFYGGGGGAGGGGGGRWNPRPADWKFSKGGEEFSTRPPY